MERVVITGCSKGIGRALCDEFMRAGWEVIASARNPGETWLENAGAENRNLRVVDLDVTDNTSVTLAAQAVSDLGGPVDVLINNAAIFPGDGDETLEKMDLAWFGEAFETNVTGVARVTRAFLPLLRQSKRPRIVNISSGAGSISAKDDFRYYPYSVSKAALNMLTRAMAMELQPDGIIVVPVSPGWVRTEMGGENAPLTPRESAAALYRTTCALDSTQAGKFLARDGSAPEYDW